MKCACGRSPSERVECTDPRCMLAVDIAEAIKGRLVGDMPDGCVHGRGFDQICIECCPEDDDGGLGDEWL